MRFLTLALVLAFGVSLSANAQSLRPSQAEKTAVFDALADKAAQQGTVRVIVNLDMDWQPEGKQASFEARRQRAMIQTLQDDVLSELVAPESVKRFRFTPAFSAEVNAADLARLRSARGVAWVQEDVPVAPHDPAPTSILAPIIESNSFLASMMMDDTTPLIGATSLWGAGFDGTGYEVAILDSGVESAHPFLTGQVVAEACFNSTVPSQFSTTLCPNGLEEQIGAGAGADCNPANYNGCSHGTHVAGTAAGDQPAAATGPTSGVAPGAGIVAINVFSGFTASQAACGGSPCILSYTSDQILGLEHVFDLVDTGGRSIVSANMSLGGGNFTATCDTDSRKTIIDNLLSVGVSTTISSGNNGYQAATGAPGCISTAVTVGSTTKTDGVSSFSNIAPWMDVFAPGSSIESSVVGGGYSFYNGTSMAAPHVAGAFALLQDAFPTETPAQLLARLTSTGVPISAGSPAANYPRIQVDAAASLAPPSFSYAPGSLTFSVPLNGSDSKQIHISNLATPPATLLTYSAAIQNVTTLTSETPAVATAKAPSAYVAPTPIPERPALRSVSDAPRPAQAPLADAPEAKAATLCTEGQTISQAAINFYWNQTTDELGQSFVAPCDGTLDSVTLYHYAHDFDSEVNLGLAFAGTVRVYDGAGTAGTVLASQAHSGTNSATANTIEPRVVTFSSPATLVEGQTYTYFFDLTSGRTALLTSNSNVYADGSLYISNTGSPSGASENASFDMTFDLTFGAPDVWIDVPVPSGSVAAGATSSFDVDVDATGLAAGTYTAEVVVTTNDAGNATATIPVTMIVGGAPGDGVVDGDPGWYLMGSPTDGTTVDQLAMQNLVAGVPGYYPTFYAADANGTAEPTLYTGYDGTSWTPSTGTSESIASGQGFLWLFWDATFTPVEPTTNPSSAVPFPVTLTAPGAVNAASVDRTLHTDGNRINAMGNPFGTALDLTDVANWPGGGKVASKGRAFVWDTALNTWIFGAAAASIEPWQGFAVRAKQSVSGATLTIPASAAAPLTAGSAAKAPEASGEVARGDRRVLAFTLEGTDARTQRRLEDRLLEVVFEEDGAIGWDEADAEKLQPLSESYLLLGVESARDGEAVLKAAESLPLDPGSVTLPLALATVGAAPTLTLRWPTLETLPADWRVTLHDIATGESVNLRSEEAYTFRAAVAPRKVFTSAPELTDADASGASTRFVLTVETGAAPVAYAETFEFGLSEIAPNPTRGQARVSFMLADEAETSVAVYDVQGREVARLVEGRREAGRHAVTWSTQSVAPGVYVVRLASGDRVETRRAVVIR